MPDLGKIGVLVAGLFLAFIAGTGALAAVTAGQWPIAVGLLVASLLLYWTWLERENTDSAAETAENVGDRASDFFGGLLTWWQATAVSAAAILLTLGDQFLMSVDLLIQTLHGAPVVSGILGAGALAGFADLWGYVSLTGGQWAVVVTALVVVGVLARRTVYGEVDR